MSESHGKSTIPGIIESVQRVRSNKQCPATHVSTRGRGANIVFCTLQEGHDGEHRGFRKRWPNTEPRS